MEKRVPGSKQVDVADQDLKKVEVSSADQKLAKIKEALKGIDWNYDTLFEDLNGFIEGHEASTSKLKLVEAEKQRLNGELNKNEQKIQFLSKKLHDNQNELNYVKRGYQQRVDELLGIKNELQQKFEGLGQKKVLNDEKMKEVSGLVRAKESEIAQYKLQAEKAELQLADINKSFADKLQKFKHQMIEKADSKEKLLIAKTNRVTAEKDQLQKYVSELMADNSRSNQDLQTIKKNLVDSNQQRDILLNQKNILTKKIDDNEKYLKLAQNKVNQFESEILLVNKKSQEKETVIFELKKQINEQKVEISKYEANQLKLDQHLVYVNQELKNKNVFIAELNEEVAELKKLLIALEPVKANYDLAKNEISKLMNEILVLNEKSNVIKQENEGVTNVIQKYKSEIEHLSSENGNLNQRYHDLQVGHEKNIEGLKLQKSELQETINLLAKDLKDTNLNLGLRNAEFESQSKKNQELIADLEFYKKEHGSLEASIGGTLTSKEQTENELNTARAELKSIKDKIVAKAVEVEELKKSLTGFEATKNSLKNLNEELNAEKKQNLILLERVTASVNKIETLEVTNLRLNKEKEELGYNLKQVEENSLKELTEVNESLANTKNVLSRKVSDIKALEGKISELEANELEYIKKNDGLNHQIQLLQDEIARSEDKNVDAQDQISAFNVQKNQFELEIIDNRQKMGALERQIEDYLQDIESEKQNYANLKNELASMEQKLTLKLNSESEVLDQIQEVEEQRDSLKSLVEDLKLELSEREQDLIQKQRMIDDVIAERKKMSLRNEELSSEISSLNIELDSKISDFVSEQKMTKDLELDLKFKMSEIVDLKSELGKGQIRLNELNDSVFNLTRDKEKLKSQIEDLNLLCEDLKVKAKLNKQEYLADMQALESEVEQLKMDKQELLDKEFELNQEVKSKEVLLQKYHMNLESLESKLSELNEELSLKQNLITQKDELEFELNDKIKTLESSAADLGFKILQAAERYDDMFKQKQILEQQADSNKALYSQVKIKDKELEVAMASIVKREEQLSLYSRWVDSQKEGIQRQVLKLASELRTTKELNPLHPYLKITEREISKIEVLMTKSNVFGPQRAQLENQYEQLIKQRDEVRELLVKTNLEVDNKAQALVSVLKSSEFIPVPPLPPGKVEESETLLLI